MEAGSKMCQLPAKANLRAMTAFERINWNYEIQIVAGTVVWCSSWANIDPTWIVYQPFAYFTTNTGQS